MQVVFIFVFIQLVENLEDIIAYEMVSYCAAQVTGPPTHTTHEADVTGAVASHRLAEAALHYVGSIRCFWSVR